METAYHLALGLHIFGGMSSLLTGLLAILARKGKQVHRISGRIYFWSMLLTCASALFISLIKDNAFLFHIGIFSLYMVFTGYRSIQNKSLQPSRLDLIMLILAMVNAIMMLISLKIVLMVFGGIGLSLAINDLRIFIQLYQKKALPAQAWILRHIGSMLGSYIATTTAFVVVNIQSTDYPIIPWLAPTVIGTPLIFIFSRKYSPKKKTVRPNIPMVLLLIGALFLTSTPHAQSYIDGGHTRHRFAQLNLGIDQRFFPNNQTSTSVVNASGLVEKKKLDHFTETRLHIGGTHFWGHADFYIAIPLTKKDAAGFYTGVETGALYYPWAVQHQKIRPYIGASFVPFRYKQGEGTELTRFKWPLMAGLTYNYKNHLIQIGCGYNSDVNEKYYITPETAVAVKTSPIWFSLGYKYRLETTVSAEKDWLSGRTKMLTDTLAALHRLDGLTIGIGPSSAFFLKKSSYLDESAPALDQHRVVDVFMEWAIGYYWHKPDVQANVSFRKINSTLEAYEMKHSVQRTAFTLETFKFICDYHGFAAFVGPALSYDQLEVNDHSDKQLRPGLTFGWDIRPNRIQSWYLRTNLRYFPNMKMNADANQSFHFDQLEFNFIQLVIFPGRFF